MLENIDPNNIEYIKTVLPMALKIGPIIWKKLEPNIKIIIKSKEEKEDAQKSIILYFENSYKANSFMNTIVFKGTPKLLKELYIPLSIIQQNDKDEIFYLQEKNIDLNYIFGCYQKIMIVDKAGMGKSTIVKHLILTALEIEGEPIPISIELRKLTSDVDLLDIITSEINLFGGYITKEQMKKLISEDQFIIFLDGYDEIKEQDKVRITEMIQRFIKQTPNAYFLLTSRDENALNSFGDFTMFTIKPLTRLEAFSLIRKYDNDGDLSRLLIEKISSDDRQFDTLNEFLSNPLMVSLLYKTFEYREEIPYKKSEFYDTVFEALFKVHDITKTGTYNREKMSSLDMIDFKKFARVLGWLTLINGKFELTLDELSSVIENAIIQMPSHDLKVAQLIDDLIKNVPLLYREGNVFRWVHKSFMEYFAASYICYDLDTDRKIAVLKKITADNNLIKKYDNLLDFYMDLDIETISTYIIVPFLKRFIERYKTKYTNKKFEDLDEIKLKYRKSLDVFIDITFLLQDQQNSQYDIDKKFYFDKLSKIKGYEDKDINDFFVMRTFGNTTINQFVFETTKDGALLNLFKNKGIDIFLSNVIEVPVKFFEVANALRMHLKLEKFYEISDNINSDLNKCNNFEQIFDIVFSDNYKVPILNKYFLDFEKCEKFIKSCEEKARAKKNDLDSFLI